MAADAVLSTKWQDDTLTAELTPGNSQECAGTYAFIKLVGVPQEVVRDNRRFLVDGTFTMRVTAKGGRIVWRKSDGNEADLLELVGIEIDCAGALRAKKRYNTIRLGDQVVVWTGLTPGRDAIKERFGVVEEIRVFL